jgi:Core-2/I-Branching enzyme
MARVCYVILVHNEPVNLLGVIGSLWNQRDVFLVWIDAKADLEFVRFANALTSFGENVQTNVGRVMSWAGFSIVDTTLMAYSALRSQVGNYSHVVLCSGTHIPLLHPDSLHERIANNTGWMDISQCAIPEAGLHAQVNLPPGWAQDILIRVRYRYSEIAAVGMLPTEERENWIEPNVLKGSQWHILRSDLVDFIVEHESEIRSSFRDVLVSDELAFQWIVSKSPRFGELRRGNHVFSQWEGASPRRLSFAEAKENASQARFLFARKAQTGSKVDDWINWCRQTLGNSDGAEWLRNASSALRVTGLDAKAPEAMGEGWCNQVLGTLRAELSAVLGGIPKLEKRSNRCYLLDSGRAHSSGGRLFFLCFVHPFPGISVVPALRQADIANDSPLRPRPRVPFFWEFVNLPIGGQASWPVRPATMVSDCERFANIALAQFQQNTP